MKHENEARKTAECTLRIRIWLSIIVNHLDEVTATSNCAALTVRFTIFDDSG